MFKKSGQMRKIVGISKFHSEIQYRTKRFINSRYKVDVEQ